MPQESIARIFFLVFAQACVGGFVLLPLTPQSQINKSFFRVMGSIFLISMLIAVWARNAASRGGGHYEWLFLWSFVGSLAAYSITTFVKSDTVNLISWAAGSLTGIALIIATALGDPLSRPGGWHSASMVLNFLIASVLLGAVTNGMLFGHWFLVDPHMTLEPLKSLILVFGGSLIAAMGLLVVNTLTLDTSRLLGDEQLFHTLLFWMRLLFGTASSSMLAFLTWRCLILGPGATKYHATRAATGLLYVAMLTAFSGELLGRFLLITTQVPV